jgi:hypothetical protein
MDGISVNKKCPANANREKRYKNAESVYSWLSPLFPVTADDFIKKKGEKSRIIFYIHQ